MSHLKKAPTNKILPITKSKIFLKFKPEGSVLPCISSAVSPVNTKSQEVCKSISAESKNYDQHKRLLNAFEGFILQLDELVVSLRNEELELNEYIPEFTTYQDICEKLRIEVLIAIDKLGLTSFSGATYNEKNIEFLHKMTDLKYQLSDIRCQYHNAIKDIDFRI